MKGALLRRCAEMVFVAFGVSVLTFLMIHLIPGDAAQIMLGAADASPEKVAALRAQGVSAEDAARRVDLRSHAKDFPDIESVGAEPRGIRRVYAWMDEQKKK